MLVWGEPTFTVTQQWDRAPDESLYGLGQHQQDLIDISDVDLGLYQHNTEIFIPFLVSSRGYGILWDNTSFTRYGELADAVPLPNTAGLYSTSPDAEAGDVAMPAQGQTVDWTGTFVRAGQRRRTSSVTYSAGGIELAVGDSQGDRPLAAALAARRGSGARAARPRDSRCRCTCTGPWTAPRASCACSGGRRCNDRGISLSSEVGDGIDYTFVYGPHRDLDRVVAGYRQLTGAAPLPPRAAFGFWQSRERYRTQDESLDVVKQFRARHIPIDYIVQDWQYWNIKRWGSHEFDRERFPDPDALDPRAARAERAADGLGVAEVLSGHAQLRRARRRAAFFFSATSTRNSATSWATSTPSTTRSIPTRAGSTGRRSTATCASAASTPGGWTRPSRRWSTDRSRRRARRSTPTRRT